MGQSYDQSTWTSSWGLPMLAGTDGKVAAAVLAASQTAANIDLTTVPALPAGFPSASTATDPNPLGHYLTLANDGANAVYVVFGPTQASVSGANAPVAATTGTNVVGLAMSIPANTVARFKLPAGDMSSSKGVGGASPARWMAYVCAAGLTTTVRIYQSSY